MRTLRAADTPRSRVEPGSKAKGGGNSPSLSSVASLRESTRSAARFFIPEQGMSVAQATASSCSNRKIASVTAAAARLA